METVTPNDSEKFAQAKADLKRKRRTAVVLGILTSFCLIFLVFAFVQKGIADEMQRETELQFKLIKEMEIKLKQCQDEALKQQAIAELTAIEAMHQQKLAKEEAARAKKTLENAQKYSENRLRNKTVF
ncbi:MAG: hypothetical protein JST43_11230 [Bacteroidetes bacterium]|nr:hypothetical protein [Bacteroidota bacterium]MBS1540044.1 hypothetical protein [Bacteroidota bacterium]